MSRRKYAANTTVSPEKSIMEVKRTLKRYEASQFMFAEDDTQAMIMFQLRGRLIKMEIPLPNIDQFQYTENGRRRRNPKAAYEQAVRQRWRAAANGVKAKLEFVDSGIRTFEQEFLSDMLLPNNQTVYKWIRPQIDSPEMPKALPFFELENPDRKLISS